VLLLAAVAVAGCGPPRLKTKSPKAVEKSISKIQEHLGPEGQERFDDALAYLVEGLAYQGGHDQSHGGVEAPIHQLYAPFDGRSGEELIELARQKRIEVVSTRIAELEGQRGDWDSVRDQLARLELREVRLFPARPGFLDRPVLEVAVSNRSGREIFMAELRAALFVPGEAVPRVVEDLRREIPTGFNPGTRVTWRFEPEQDEWQSLPAGGTPYDLEVEVVGLYGVGGRRYASTSFDGIDARTLDALAKRLQELEAAAPAD
jgi:hypothetical protein